MSSKNSQNSFQLKADFFPMTVLKISKADLHAFDNQLQLTIAKAPNYFTRAPVVIDVESIKLDNSINLEKICHTLRQHNIIPVGVRGLADKQLAEAQQQGLAVLKLSKHSNESAGSQPEKNNMAANTATITAAHNKIITKPIRAGSQVYAKDGDLIILAAVNPGAECIADGNIHIYGPLRGRALAGARGNTSARIFCQSLEADLISIAGNYVVSEDLVVPKTNSAMLQIFLKDDALQIEGL